MSGERETVIRLTLSISDKVHNRLDQLRHTTGKNSTEDVVLDAIHGYLRSHESVQALSRLTPRQREVLQLIAAGHKTREIARMLDISVKTVEMHRAQLMETLDLRNIADVVRFAVRAGVISP